VSATIYIARHGETTWNVAGRYQGRLESPLSALGVAQAHALAEYFGALAERGAAVRHIVSSPLVRCTQTAQAVADRLGLAVSVDERLIEIAHGTWEGRYRDEIAANDPQRYRTWRNDPEHVAFERGETLRDVVARYRSFAASLVHATADTLVVTHDAICRVALLEAMGRPLHDFWRVHVENGAFAVLHADGERLSVVEECHAEHLASLRAPLEGQAL
jgi:broad specificity phosphatase PhoE